MAALPLQLILLTLMIRMPGRRLCHRDLRCPAVPAEEAPILTCCMPACTHYSMYACACPACISYVYRTCMHACRGTQNSFPLDRSFYCMHVEYTFSKLQEHDLHVEAVGRGGTVHTEPARALALESWRAVAPPLGQTVLLQSCVHVWKAIG